MLINVQTAISTSKILLVPYCPWHVPRYHDWMKDEEIQAATASEPLTLEEEYAMQQSWRKDPDKLTFIVCLPTTSSSADAAAAATATATATGPSTSTSTANGSTPNSPSNSNSGNTDTSRPPANSDPNHPGHMIGDINLFLRIDDGEEGDAEPRVVGEIELMIAEKKNHRQGYGKAALLAFMRYVAERQGGIVREYVSGDAFARERMGGRGDVDGGPGLSCVSVKIGETNEASLGLFEACGFGRWSKEANVFGEVELRREMRGLDETIGGELVQAGLDGYLEVEYGSLSMSD